MAMKVILTKEIANLGKPGTMVTVKPGYGRNYLLPRNLAVLATDKNVRRLEHEKSGILARSAKEKSNMTAMAKKLEAIELKFTRKVGEQNKLFGSVTSKDIHEIDRRQIHLPEPLKELGTHEVEIKLHPEVSAKLKVSVSAEG
jgi:large subunit ribosomal protein L9